MSGKSYTSLDDWTREALINEVCKLRLELDEFMAPDDDLIIEFESVAVDLVTKDRITDFLPASWWQKSKEPWRRYKSDVTEGAWRLWSRF